MTDREQMARVADALDELFNGDRAGEERTTGFLLMVWPFGEEPADCQFVTNCERQSVVVLMKEMAARLSGQPEVEGNA